MSGIFYNTDQWKNFIKAYGDNGEICNFTNECKKELINGPIQIHIPEGDFNLKPIESGNEAKEFMEKPIKATEEKYNEMVNNIKSLSEQLILLQSSKSNEKFYEESIHEFSEAENDKNEDNENSENNFQNYLSEYANSYKDNISYDHNSCDFQKELAYLDRQLKFFIRNRIDSAKAKSLDNFNSSMNDYKKSLASIH